MKQGKIYVLLEPKTGKVRYVGLTQKSLSKRLVQHLYRAKKQVDLTWHRLNWLRSLDSPPKIKQIDSADTLTELMKKEIWWINYFRKKGCNLTNSTDGGEGMPYGAVKGHIKARSIKIKQFTLDGKYIKTHKSITEACIEVTGNKKGNGKICMVCKGKRRMAYGYIWRYEADFFGKYQTTIKKVKYTQLMRKRLSESKKGKKNPQFGKNYGKASNAVPIYQYDLNGKLIKEWDSLLRFRQVYEPTHNLKFIYRALHNTYNLGDFYISKNKYNILPNRKIKKVNFKNAGLSIQQLDINLNIINEFKSISKAYAFAKNNLNYSKSLSWFRKSLNSNNLVVNHYWKINKMV